MNNAIRIMYLRQPNGHPNGCLAMKLDRQNKKIEYQLSVVNPLDHFDKTLGRLIALGRLEAKPYELELNTDDVDMHNVSHAVMEDIASSEGLLPTRAVKSAQYWLSNTKE